MARSAAESPTLRVRGAFQFLGRCYTSLQHVVDMAGDRSMEGFRMLQEYGSTDSREVLKRSISHLVATPPEG
eukprot:113493-Prymnesium_polylepis.1